MAATEVQGIAEVLGVRNLFAAQDHSRSPTGQVQAPEPRDSFDLIVNDPDDGEGKEDHQGLQAILVHWVAHVHRVLNLAEADLRQEQRQTGHAASVQGCERAHRVRGGIVS